MSNMNNIACTPPEVKGVVVTRRLLRGPLEDVNGRHPEDLMSPALPRISEEVEDKENPSAHEGTSTSTPRSSRRAPTSGGRPYNKGSGDSAPVSSTPLSRRHATPHKLHKTPAKQKPYNPFESELISRLHLPICSPSVFSVVVSPSKSLDQGPNSVTPVTTHQNSGDGRYRIRPQENFDWPIEDVSRIKPVLIEESPSQFEYVEDPETESRVQEVIDTFFREKQIVPSPWCPDRGRSSVLQLLPHSQPERPQAAPLKTVSSQTMLSLPPILPPDLEAALRPYFNQAENDAEASAEDEEVGCYAAEELAEESGLNQSGLRRKLFFHAAEGGCEGAGSSGERGGEEQQQHHLALVHSPVLLSRWEAGLSRTNMEGSRDLRSPSISPIDLGAAAQQGGSQGSGRTTPPIRPYVGVASSGSSSGVGGLHCSHMDVSFQTATPGTPLSRKQALISALMDQEEAQEQREPLVCSWIARHSKHVIMQDMEEESRDQTMDSCHGTPVTGNSPVSHLISRARTRLTESTDQGYHTVDLTSSMQAASHGTSSHFLQSRSHLVNSEILQQQQQQASSSGILHTNSQFLQTSNSKILQGKLQEIWSLRCDQTIHKD